MTQATDRDKLRAVFEVTKVLEKESAMCLWAAKRRFYFDEKGRCTKIIDTALDPHRKVAPA